MKKVINEVAPLFVMCPKECTVVLQRMRDSYLGRCPHESYYWDNNIKSDFELADLERLLYYDTDVDSTDRVYRLPFLSKEYGRELTGMLANPFENTIHRYKTKWFYRHWFLFHVEFDDDFYNEALKLEGNVLYCPDKWYYTTILYKWFLEGCKRHDSQ